MLALFNKLLGKKPKAEKDVQKPVQPKVAPSAFASVKPFSDDFFETSRLDLVQKMWGEGYSMPGDAEFIKQLVQPLGLHSHKTMLDLSAGLGGPMRYLADTYDTQMIGFERDDEFAHVGNKMSLASGNGRNAPIQHYEPANFLCDKKADAIMAREIFYTCTDKDAFLVRLAAVLKPNAHLILTDFTSEVDHLERPEVASWIDSEPHRAHLISTLEQSQILTKHNFDVRVSANISKDYSRMITQGLARLLKHLEGKRLSPHAKALVGDEVDFWTRRIAALDAGVTYTRYYAVRTH
jgi:cyclopropane fatty-acyl-phospholipid synthase-like methyltransferase